jgi:hypothetical protein
LGKMVKVNESTNYGNVRVKQGHDVPFALWHGIPSQAVWICRKERCPDMWIKKA